MKKIAVSAAVLLLLAALTLCLCGCNEPDAKDIIGKWDAMEYFMLHQHTTADLFREKYPDAASIWEFREDGTLNIITTIMGETYADPCTYRIVKDTVTIKHTTVNTGADETYNWKIDNGSLILSTKTGSVRMPPVW